MDFGNAIKELKKGNMVARAGLIVFGFWAALSDIYCSECLGRMKEDCSVSTLDKTVYKCTECKNVGFNNLT